MTVPTLNGEVITFCSYKGGTGRSMAVANVACALAGLATEHRVLVVDWDLEAPGLHRYFSASSPADRALGAGPLDSGLIDLMLVLREALKSIPAAKEEVPDERSEDLWRLISPEIRPVATTVAGVDLLKAGRFDEHYTTHVATFNWVDFFESAPWLLPWLFQKLSERYHYILIDSRTGITDTSGICSGLLPEKLVVVFTPNRQSVDGACDLVRRALRYRASSDDLRPLRVFPLPSRIEPVRPKLKEHWRFDSNVGYQPAFERTLKEVYQLADCNLQEYFDEIQIQQVPDYAYGEEIAVAIEKTEDRLSLSRSYGTLTQLLVRSSQPWERDVPEVVVTQTVRALTDLLQAIALELHVSGGARGFTKTLSTFEAACRSSLPLTDEQYRLVKGDAEWVIRRWVEEDQQPSWQGERSRLASARVPEIDESSSFLVVVNTSLRCAASIVAEAAAIRDVIVEVSIESGWSAWSNLAGHFQQTTPSAVKAENTYGDGAAARLTGPLSSFANVLASCSDVIAAHQPSFESSLYRQAEPGPETRLLEDIGVVTDQVWSRLVSGHSRQLEHGAALSPSTLTAIMKCSFSSMIGDAASPHWRKARDRYCVAGLATTARMGFVEFLGFYLATVSKLIDAGVGTEGHRLHTLGFSIGAANFDIAERLEVVPKALQLTDGTPDRPLAIGPLKAFATAFHDGSRALLDALRVAEI